MRKAMLSWNSINLYQNWYCDKSFKVRIIQNTHRFQATWNFGGKFPSGNRGIFIFRASFWETPRIPRKLRTPGTLQVLANRYSHTPILHFLFHSYYKWKYFRKQYRTSLQNNHQTSNFTSLAKRSNWDFWIEWFWDPRRPQVTLEIQC